MKRLLPVIALTVLAAACGSSSPTAPSTPKATTRVITVAGNLAFGDVNIGETADRTFTINNSGTGTLTFTSLSCSGGTGSVGYTASPTSGAVAPGATTTVSIHFAPTIGQFYSCVLSVLGDQTSGNNAINVSGSGINNTPLFTQSGKGDSVFNIPSSVAIVHVTGHFINTGSNSNFIVDLNGRGFINEILRNSDYSGTLQTPGGGLIAITNSGSIAWTFTEVR